MARVKNEQLRSIPIGTGAIGTRAESDSMGSIAHTQAEALRNGVTACVSL
jgi:hypothetical protein